MTNINWNSYSKTFPIRYTKQSYFDEYLEGLLDKDKGIKKVLDVGGGDGTEILNHRGLEVWLYDPYREPADWMAGKKEAFVGLDYYDLIIARNSINYLLIGEITTLYKGARRFLANTFYKPPNEKWSARKYYSVSSEGMELSRLHGGRVEHILVDKQGNTHEHSFLYYPLQALKVLMPEVKVYHYGKNSILLEKE